MTKPAFRFAPTVNFNSVLTRAPASRADVLITLLHHFSECSPCPLGLSLHTLYSCLKAMRGKATESSALQKSYLTRNCHTSDASSGVTEAL